MPLHVHPTTYGNPHVSGDINNVYIGKYCSIADTVLFDGGLQHNHKFVTSYPLWKIGVPENREGMCRGDIHVGNDVWIGDGAMIMSGVTIGDGAVIGARAVVTKDVFPYHVVVGSPARYRRNRFPDPDWKEGLGYERHYHSKIEARLLASKWWDLPESRIRELGPLMLSTDIEAFLREVEK